MALKARAVLVFPCLILSLVSGAMVKRSDDVGIQALQTLVQQQASAISALEAKLAALSTVNADVANLKNKVATLSTAVAFSAIFSTDDGFNGIPLSTHATLLFDKTITNVGNAYSTITGIFTAPVTGVYAFALNMMAPTGLTHGYLSLAIVKQGAILDQVWAPATHADDQGSTDVTTHLTAGEQVWVRQQAGDAVRGCYWTVFTGYLLHAH